MHLTEPEICAILWIEKVGSYMTVFKTFTLKWWEGALFKWGMLALGIVVGAYWHEFFGGILAPLIVVAVLTLGYVTYIWWKQ